jgi:hypothetical protein
MKNKAQQDETDDNCTIHDRPPIAILGYFARFNSAAFFNIQPISLLQSPVNRPEPIGH